MVSERISELGLSRAETIYDLVVRLHCLCMRYRCQVRFIHVSSTRMIGQVIDRLSRGSLYRGVINGKPMLLFLSLGESVLKRLEKLGRLIYQWDYNLGRSVETLDPEGWVVRGRGHGRGEESIDGVWIPKFRTGTFICIPSLGVARIFIEELCQARHKRTDSAHVLVVPRIIWNKGRRHVHKLEDLILGIPAGSGYIWPQEIHETLIFAIYLPFLNRFPWELRRKNLLVGVVRHLRGGLKKYHSLVEDMLSQIFQKTRVSRRPKFFFPSE